MSRGVNKAILIGHLGADPEVKYMPSGGAVANVNLATTERWKDRQTGEQQERTEWHRLTFYGRTAEVAGEYLRKGSQVYVEGRIQTRKWQGQDGQDRYTTEIIVNDMQMLGGRGAGGGSADNWDQPSEPRSAPASSGGAPQSKPPSSAAAPAGSGSQFDDDIPF